jgi:hypothetical protein
VRRERLPDRAPRLLAVAQLPEDEELQVRQARDPRLGIR